MPSLKTAEQAFITARISEVFKVWTGREQDYLTVSQVAVASGLRVSQVLGALESMVASGVLEQIAGVSAPRYRVNARPTPEQLRQKLALVKAVEAARSLGERDFAY